jgi:hypothetical protein
MFDGVPHAPYRGAGAHAPEAARSYRRGDVLKLWLLAALLLGFLAAGRGW